MATVLVVYLIMMILAALAATQSIGAFFDHKLRGLKYFGLLFAALALYLFTRIIVIGFEIQAPNAGAVLALGRLFVVAGVISLFQTPVYQTNLFFRNNNKLILGGVVLSALVGFAIRVVEADQVIVQNGIIILKQPAISAIIYCAISLFAALSWLKYSNSYAYAYRKIQNSLKIMMLGIAGIFLAIGDSIYLIAQDINISLLGSTIALIGYTVVMVALSIKKLRSVFANQ